MARQRMTKEQQHAAKAAYETEVATKQQYAILAPVVQGAASPAAAAEQLHNLSRTVDANDAAYDTANCALVLAKRTPPEAQGPLVDALHTLRDLPAVTEASSGAVAEVDGGKLWSDLPTFGIVLTDELSSIKANATDLVADEATSHERVTSFAARLTALPNNSSSTDSWSPVDFSYHSLIAFNNAFDQDDASPLAVRCACRWVELAAPVLYAHHKAGRRLPSTADSELPEFDIKYWNGWRQGMARVGANVDGKWAADVAAMAKDALARMESAEKA